MQQTSSTGRGGQEADEDDIDEEMQSMYANGQGKQAIVPSKSQVLFYLSTSLHLRVQQTGSDMQVDLFFLSSSIKEDLKERSAL